VAGRGRLRVRKERIDSRTRHKFRLRKPRWHDPFPWIPGTEPEKRIFEALVQRNIYFRYQADAPAELRKLTLAHVGFVPDFVLPEYKVVIDPFSPFHHSLESAVERDTRKIALFTAAGYEYYHPWALADGMFSLDQPDHVLGVWRWQKPRTYRTKKGKRVKQYGNQPVFNTDERGRSVLRTREAPKVGRGIFSAGDLLMELPLVAAGPRFPLVDEEDTEAKRERGYFLGEHLGLGASSVGAANRRRRRQKSLAIRRLRDQSPTTIQVNERFPKGFPKGF
jgi:hypothetical protein